MFPWAPLTYKHPSFVIRMAATRSGSKGKGRARAVSPRAAACARPSAARVAAARTTVERAASLRALNAANSAEDEDRPYEDEGKTRSFVTPRVDGNKEETVLTNIRRFIGGTSTSTIIHLLCVYLPISGRPKVICSTTATTTDTTIEVLYDDEAIAFLAGAAAANVKEAEDPFAMVISRASSPELPASLNDAEALNRLDRHTAATALVSATREEISARIAIEAADEALAQRLQAAEDAAAHAEQSAARASTSRRMIASTPDPATPMEITPNPTPVILRTAPTSPTPSGRAVPAPGHVLRGFPALDGIAREAGSRMTFNPTGALPRGQTAMAPPAYFGTSAQGRGFAAGPGSASTSRQPSAGPSTARAGPSGPPAYSKDAPGTSYFVLPTRPTPRNRFSEHQVIKTSTELVNGTPVISIMDSDAEDNDEEPVQETDN